MICGSYYNEIDSYAAAWLRNLIASGHIAPGEVDERSIADVQPDDLLGFAQCHFFAGIGVWSYALRRAGWPDDLPVWTGSCPCQPFSAAGRGEGFADERHLWPAFHHLIAQRRPPVVFGEQVASKAVDPWIDLVQDDLEGLGYAFGAVPFPSAGVGAPHIRDRAYFVAHAGRTCGQRWSNAEGLAGASAREWNEGSVHNQPCGGIGKLADTHQSNAAQIHASHDALDEQRAEVGRRSVIASGAGTGSGVRGGDHSAGRPGVGHNSAMAGLAGPGPTNGFWRDPDWLHCRDGRWRPVEPGTFPLAHGAPARVGRLRAYGNAINAEAAAAFISASLDVMEPAA